MLAGAKSCPPLASSGGGDGTGSGPDSYDLAQIADVNLDRLSLLRPGGRAGAPVPGHPEEARAVPRARSRGTAGAARPGLRTGLLSGRPAPGSPSPLPAPRLR